MTFTEHLATDDEKFQSGVSLRDARNLVRQFLNGISDSPDLDADLILENVCGVSRLDLITKAERVLDLDESKTVVELLLRRARKEPIAYLLGEKEFFGLAFKVTNDVLIPRPDTELLVEEALKYLTTVDNAKVVDVCTGSGCVAISIAHHAPTAHVIATDLSDKALKVARQNTEILGVTSTVELRCGDLLVPCRDERDVDLIVSNPPYIRPIEMAGLMPDVRDFEPHLALLGEEEDGLGHHRRILAQSLPVLKAGGALIMEIGTGQAEILSRIVFPGFSSPEFLKDYAGILRIVKYSRLPSELSNKVGAING